MIIILQQDYSRFAGKGQQSHERNSPHCQSPAAINFSDCPSGTSNRMYDTNRMLRSMAFSNPISPERQSHVDNRFEESNIAWQSASRYLNQKLKRKNDLSLIEQQERYKTTLEDFFTPTSVNDHLPGFISKKGKSRDMPDQLRSWYQNLRNGKEGCGFVYEALNAKNPSAALWAIQPSPNKITSNFRNELKKAMNSSHLYSTGIHAHDNFTAKIRNGGGYLSSPRTRVTSD